MKKRIISFLVAIAVVITSLNLPIASTAATQEDGNLFYGLTATTNNTNSWATSERPISNLTDGDGTFGYNAGKTTRLYYNDDGTVYAQFNLTSATDINKFVIYLSGTTNTDNSTEQQTRNYAVDIQLSDGSWKRVAEQHLDEYTNWDYNKQTLCFETVNTSVVRFTFKKANDVQLSAPLSEIEAYNDSTITENDYTTINSANYTANAIPMPAYTNLLPGTTVTANAEHYDGWYDTYRPISKLTDGENEIVSNAGKLMVTPYGTNGQACINFAFVNLTTINKVVVYLPGTTSLVPTTNQVTDYAIDAQLEDGTWVRVAEKHAAPYDKWDYYSHTFKFDAVTCTDLRLTSVNADGQTTASFCEIEAYNIYTQTSADNTDIDSANYTANAVPMPAYKNLLPGTTVTANAEHYDGWYDTYRPISKLTDGENEIVSNAGKLMVTPYGTNGQACINFAFVNLTTINKVVVYLPGTTSLVPTTNQVTDYALDARLEDGTWVRVVEKHAAPYDKWDYYSHTFKFDAVTCTDLRLTSVNTDGQTSASFCEIEAYNIYTQTSADNTDMDSADYTAKAVPMPVYTNLLPGTTITANAEHYDEWYNYERPISKLTDGEKEIVSNAGKLMVTPYGANGEAYIDFAFANLTMINKVIVYLPGTSNLVPTTNQVTDYALDARLEDGTWVRVAEKHVEPLDEQDYYSHTFKFDVVTCTNLRLTSVKTDDQTSASFCEIEAYHMNTVAPEDHTLFDSGATIPQPKSADWVKTEVPALDDYAYSFAVVGDTQIVSKNDAKNGTTDLANMYQYIIDKKDEYKISQVIGLGDIVDTYADGDQKEAEWNVALNAIKKLDGVLPYTLIPGNHDVNWNFNYRIGNVGKLGYLNQSQIISQYGKKEAYEAGYEVDENDAQKEPSASNTAHAFTAGGRNYLILTLEYAAISTQGVMDWADKVVKAHPYHNVIVTTHAYLAADGSILDGTQVGSPSSYAGSSEHNNGDYFWNNLISQNDNIVMVLCGHVGTDDIVISPKARDNGTTVTQIMVNPQDLEAEIGSTGMLAFMYFSADGKTVQLRQYSTVWNRYYGNESQTSFDISVIEPIEGDVNADREVDVRDLIRYKKYVLKADNSVVISELTSDLNSDSEFDTDDIIVLRKTLVGIEEYDLDSNADKSVVYLSSRGKDTWTGTESQPYGTLDKAIAAVHDNGIIQIQGTYELGADFVWEKHNKTVTISGGALDGTALGSRISLGDSVTFDNITLVFTEDSYLFANGYPLTIYENITMTNRIRVYGGGQEGSTVASTDLKIYGGSYEAIYGGSNGGTVTGNTNVVVGGNVNKGITPKHNDFVYSVYGGGVADIVKGKTKVTFGGNAKANYVFGGSFGALATVSQGTNVYITGGTTSGVYGGGNGTEKSGIVSGGVYVKMTGGTVEQVFGGNAASDLTGDVKVEILGGTVTRRIYGGCYNEFNEWTLSWTSSYSVKGTITLTLSGNANLVQSYNGNDLSVFARSRLSPKSNDEVSVLIYADGGENQHGNKIGANDNSAKLMMSGVSAYDSYTTQ